MCEYQALTQITVDHVSKTYTIGAGQQQRQCAIDDMTFQVKSGESLAILGPSGSGKTTLLRLIAGLETPDFGAVYYEDQNLTDVGEQDRGIGMVFQDYALIPHWDARRTIGFFLRLRHREREVPARVRRVSAITGVGLDKLMGRFPRELSGGEKQRVAIARAFARDMRVLLFDEPFANLDAKFRTNARLELRRLLNEFHVTTIIVTHDQHEAASLSERILLLDAGRIVQLGPYSHLHDDPENLFVAEFIGVPRFNFFEGRVQEGVWQHSHFGRLELPRIVGDGTRLTVAVRPEHLQLCSEGAPGAVEMVTPHFSERYNLVEMAHNELQWQIQVPLGHHVRVGEVLHCKFDADKVLFFDSVSGVRFA